MVGSLVVFEGSSVEEVKKLIEDDIYYTSGVVCPARLSMQILTSHDYFKVGSRTHNYPTFPRPPLLTNENIK